MDLVEVREGIDVLVDVILCLVGFWRVGRLSGDFVGWLGEDFFFVRFSRFRVDGYFFEAFIRRIY